MKNQTEAIAEGAHVTDVQPGNVECAGCVWQHGAQEDYGTITWTGALPEQASPCPPST